MNSIWLHAYITEFIFRKTFHYTQYSELNKQTLSSTTKNAYFSKLALKKCRLMNKNTDIVQNPGVTPSEKSLQVKRKAVIIICSPA